MTRAMKMDEINLCKIPFDIVKQISETLSHLWQLEREFQVVSIAAQRTSSVVVGRTSFDCKMQALLNSAFLTCCGGDSLAKGECVSDFNTLGHDVFLRCLCLCLCDFYSTRRRCKCGLQRAVKIPLIVVFAADNKLYRGVIRKMLRSNNFMH